jgi:hypothetical protein
VSNKRSFVYSTVIAKLREIDDVELDRLWLVNYWMISGIANIGFLIFFLTQSIGRETHLSVLVSNSPYLRDERLATVVVIALLAAIAIISFILGSRTKK